MLGHATLATLRVRERLTRDLLLEGFTGIVKTPFEQPELEEVFLDMDLLEKKVEKLSVSIEFIVSLLKEVVGFPN
jgi:hypothetical protein